jgi:potassium-transporting ATPase potassium-binding subunit
MFAGRFLVIVPVLCIAGTMTNKGRVEPAVGAVPTHGIQFVGLLVGAILTVGGLTF